MQEEVAKEESLDKKTKSKDIEDGKSMHIKIYAPFKVYYDGPANSISAQNATGPFDILPKHHNFMTLLGSCEVIVRYGENEKKIQNYAWHNAC